MCEKIPSLDEDGGGEEHDRACPPEMPPDIADMLREMWDRYGDDMPWKDAGQ